MKSLKLYVLPLLSLLLASESTASQPEDMCFVRLTEATDKEFWHHEGSSNKWQQSTYLHGWNWDKFSEKLNAHAPESLKELLKGKHRRSQLLLQAQDQSRSALFRSYAALLLLNRIRDYISAKEHIYKQAANDKKSVGNEFYAQDNIKERLSQANLVKTLLSGLMLDAITPNKDMSKHGIERHKDLTATWVARSAVFLDSLEGNLDVEQVSSWWNRVSVCGEQGRFSFYLCRHKNILNLLQPMLRAPLARAMLNDLEQTLTEKEIEDYIYYLYLDRDYKEELLSQDLAQRVSALGKITLNRPHDCYLALHLARSLASPQAPKFAAELVERALICEEYAQRDEIVVRALSYYAPLYLDSIGKMPTAEQMAPVQSWIRYFDNKHNQCETVQAAIAQFNQTYPFQQAFLRFLALNQYMGEKGPDAIRYYLPANHPALNVSSLPTRVDQCEFMLSLVKDEKDPEIAYLLTRWGIAIAHAGQQDTKEYQNQRYVAESKRKDQLQVQWGDYEESHHYWSHRDKEHAMSLYELEALMRTHDQ